MVKAIGEAAWRRLQAQSAPLTIENLRTLSPMVILAPHADDETLGCGGLLSVAAAAELQPRVVYLTDSAASHRNSALWSYERLKSVRREEALGALAALGVSASQVKFMDWPDASPPHPESVAYEATFERLSGWLDTFGARSIWAPRRGESHCDHQAASALADHLARRPSANLRCMDYMVWGWNDDAVAAARADETVWSLSCAAFVPQRRRALACHQTQTTGLIADAEEAFLIPDDLAALVDRPAEIFLERR